MPPMSSRTTLAMLPRLYRPSIAEPAQISPCYAAAGTPLELWEAIIDYLHEDPHTLTVCGLVCRAWIPASRTHLFNSITIRQKNITGLLCLLESPLSTVAQFIRTVNLSESAVIRNTVSVSWSKVQLNRIDALLNNLESLVIKGETLWWGPTAIDPPLLRKVASLTMDRVGLISFVDFTSFISSFPSLVSLNLILDSVEPFQDASATPPPCALSTLKHLTVNWLASSYILPWFQTCSKENSPSIISLNAKINITSGISAVNEFFGLFPGLEQLGLMVNFGQQRSIENGDSFTSYWLFRICTEAQAVINSCIGRFVSLGAALCALSLPRHGILRHVFLLQMDHICPVHICFAASHYN